MNNKRHAVFLIATFVTLAFLCLPAFAEEKRLPEIDSLSSLKNLQGVEIAVVGVNLPEEVGLTQVQIKSEVELKLRAEGVRVLTGDEDSRTPGSPSLHVRVHTMDSPDQDLYVYSIRVELRQWATMLRDWEIKIYVPTWSTEVMGITGTANVKTTVLDAVRESIGRFTKAYRGVNPGIGI
ncbi:MAG TPA: hypothetical protein VLB01_08105 [Thermodesulfobacteriota bacterium]|nr:hypothetical protein [Thermodesulfobacteriota bacterium]